MSGRVLARWLTVPALLLAGGAQGQTGACEQLTTRLATRIESTGVRGYSLDVVPATAPVPRDGKVIGTCEAGARKVVYRRWGGAAAVGTAPTAPPPAARAAPPSTPPAQPAEAPPVAEAAAPVAVAAAPIAPVLEPAVPAPPASASDLSASAMQPEPPASAVQATASAAAPDAGGGSATIAVGLIEYWPWLAAGLVLVAGGWIWRSRFSAYDEGGLPRGPRL